MDFSLALFATCDPQWYVISWLIVTYYHLKRRMYSNVAGQLFLSAGKYVISLVNRNWKLNLVYAISAVMFIMCFVPYTSKKVTGGNATLDIAPNKTVDVRKSNQSIPNNVNNSYSMSSPKIVLIWTPHTRFRGFTGCSWNCNVTTERRLITQADMVLFHVGSLRLIGSKREVDELMPRPDERSHHQQWVFVSNESPESTYRTRMYFYNMQKFINLFNLTMNFMESADISIPYGRYIKSKSAKGKDWVAKWTKGKTKLVLWFVSHCKIPYRQMYALDLKKHLGQSRVDQYGRCSGIEDPCQKNTTCLETFTKQYKFYLAFENSRCQDYITEKFWNTLKAGMVPIVIGPSIENYKQLAPPNSFIHVDNFTSPEALADYLLYVDRTPEVYAAYHAWREEYEVVEKPGWWWGKRKIDFDTGEDGMWCKVCKAAHQLSGINKTISLSHDWNPKKLCGSRSEAKFLKEYKN